jgi:serine/threonine protein kinase
MLDTPFYINHYYIKDIIDSCEFSSVHLALNVNTQEECCMKIIQKSYRNIHLIRNEIKILKFVNHPNIVSFIDYIETATHFLIFQELCEGKTLLDVIVENGKLEENFAKQIFWQLIKALDYLQKKGVSH